MVMRKAPGDETGFGAYPRIHGNVRLRLELGYLAGSDDEEEGGAGESTGANRYLFLTARFNPDLVPPPELEELPEVPEPGSDGDEEATTQPAAETKLERIDQENQRKLDEYDQKLQDGRDKVKELNDRFADWYYVISDSVYEKIRLRRLDVVQLIEPSADDDETSAASVDG